MDFIHYPDYKPFETLLNLMNFNNIFFISIPGKNVKKKKAIKKNRNYRYSNTTNFLDFKSKFRPFISKKEKKDENCRYKCCVKKTEKFDNNSKQLCIYKL